MGRTHPTTSDEAQYYSFIIDWTWTIGAPVILVVGVTGNVLALVVLYVLRKNKLTSYTFLLALSVSDLLIQLCSLLPRWLDRQFGVVIENYSTTSCRYFKWISHSSGMLSAFLVVAVAVGRALDVVRPRHANRTVTHKRVRLGIAGLTWSVLCINLYTLFLFEHRNGICSPTEGLAKRVTKYASVINALLYSILPFVGMLMASIVLVAEVVRVRRRVTLRSLIGDSLQSSSRSTTGTPRLGTVIFLTLFAFLVLTLPTAVTRTLEAFDTGQGFSFSNPKFWLAYEVSRFVWYINNAINFYLYILAGRSFRGKALYILRRLCMRHIKRMSMRSHKLSSAFWLGSKAVRLWLRNKRQKSDSASKQQDFVEAKQQEIDLEPESHQTSDSIDITIGALDMLGLEGTEGDQVYAVSDSCSLGQTWSSDSDNRVS